MSVGGEWVERARFRVQAAGLAALVGLTGAVFAVAGPAVAAPPPECPTSAADEAAASRAAQDCHGRVEVTSARDERTQVFANASGSLTAETAAVVQRVRDSGNRWVKPDATLRADGQGRFVPGAAALDVSFSGGGGGPAVTIGEDTAELSLTWPGALPTPKISGATATYGEVLPGVDLALTAQVEGFSEVLVVKTAQAARNPALSAVRFTTKAKGLSLRQGSGGELTAVKAGGGTLFASGAPMMWDSGDPGKGSSTGSRLAVPGAKSKVMPVELAGDQLVVRPDTSMLRSAATTFPVYIDPVFTRSAWTMINSRFPDQSYWSYDRQDCPAPYQSIQCAKVGYTTTPQSMIYRSLFSFGIGSVMKKHIQSAILSMDTVYSYTNTDYVTEVRVAGAISSSTKWSNNASSWGGVVASAKSHAYDRVRRRTEWGLTSPVRTAAAGTSSTLTLGLRAQSESNVNQWKKFDAATAKLTVEYNSFPNPPSGVTIAELPCRTGASRPYVRTLTPGVVAKLSDPDGTKNLLKGKFYWWKVGTGRTEANSVSQGSIVHNNNAMVKIPAGRLTDNTTYALQSFTSDGIDLSQPAHCEFTVDMTAPGKPGTPVSATYPADGQAHGGAGVTGAFTLKPPATVPADFWGYAYSLDPGATPAAATQVPAPVTTAAPVTTCSGPGQVPSAASDRSVSVCLTPAVDRAYNLRVWAKDKAGNFSDPVTYAFIVAAGAGPAARWTFDDNTGTDVTEHGNLTTVTGGAFEPGRGKYGSALKTDGSTTYAVTTGPITTRNAAGQPVTLHPNQSFTIAATVKLGSTTGSGQRIILAQDGARTSPFVLSYSVADKKWRFAVAATDVDAPATAAVLSNATASTGTWTRLMGTYDGSSRALRLYVNGVLQTATATATAAFDSARPVTIGRGIQAGAAGGHFPGAIDDARIYGRIVNASESEFTNLQRPNPPLVTFTGPDGNKVDAGQNLAVKFDNGADPAVTRVQYQLGISGKLVPEDLGAGGVLARNIPIPASATLGAIDLFAQAIDANGLTSTIVTLEVIVEKPSSLTGKVVDPVSNDPLSGLTVRLSPGDLAVTTSATGEYTFTGLDKATYVVSVDNGGIGCAAAKAEWPVDVAGDTYQILMPASQADTYGYTCDTATAAFVAGTTKLALAGEDEAVAVTQLPFPVPYYGKSYSSLWVSTNGFISFTDPAGRNDYNGVSLPDRHDAPVAALAPYLSDLVIDDASGVWTAATGTGAGQRFVVEWRNALIAGTTTRVTFAAVLAPSGSVTFHYSGLSGELAQGSNTVVGITSPGGNYGLQYSFQEAALVSGRTVTFTPPPADRSGVIVGSVTGLVTDSHGDYRGGVHVWLDERGGATDESGMFQFDDVEYGAYNLYLTLGCENMEDTAFAVGGDELTLPVMAPATDTFGNRCALSSAGWVPGTTEVAFGGGYETAVTLPFPVSFYGHRFTDVTVQNWGAVSFADAADPAVGGGVQVWPAADPVVDEQTKVHTTTVGTAPNRQFVIEWRAVPLDGVPGVRTDLELILDENSSITANARNLPDRTATAKDAEIYYWGTEYDSVLYYEDGNGLRAGNTVTFSPPPAA